MGVQHVRHMIVGDIFPAPGEEAQILEPVQGLTLITFSQRLTDFPNEQIRPGYWAGAASFARYEIRRRLFALRACDRNIRVETGHPRNHLNDMTRARVLTFQNVL